MFWMLATNQVVWAAARLPGGGGELLTDIVCHQASSKMKHFGPQELSVLAHSLAKQGQVDPILFG